MESFVSQDFKDKYGGGVIPALIKGMLNSKLVDQVLAFVVGLNETDIVPSFLSSGDEVGQIVTSSYNPGSLARFVKSYSAKGEKIGVLVRSCDARALVELAKRGQVNMDNLYLIGIECYGVSRPQQGGEGELYILTDDKEELIRANCQRCEYPVPSMADLSCRLDKEITSIQVNSEKGKKILDSCPELSPVKKEIERNIEAREKRAQAQQEKDFSELKEMSAEDRLNYWFSQFDKCIKCYGCRNSCPLCYCKECYLEADRKLVKGGKIPPERLFHLTRLMHIGDSCLNCGQCEDACPMEIPLAKLYHMLYKELSSIFNYESGIDPNALPPLATFIEEELKEEEAELD